MKTAEEIIRQKFRDANITAGVNTIDPIVEAMDEYASLKVSEAKESQWISVTTRLPEHLDRVLIVFEGGHVMMAAFQIPIGKTGEFVIYFADGRQKTERTVTHWMPLPTF